MQEHPVDSPLRVIGRYALYGALAAGGMATVHFGRLLGPAGFSRTVAIKRLHPQYAKDPEFVAMFLDEARLAARIQHPNVVATVDVVAMQEELFLVMDYIRGESFSRLLRASRKRKIAVPLRIIASVITGMLHGLHAAHEAKDERGQPLSIVHRDVSPQNVLVGVDGIARVLDFGVAKAAARIQVTRDGQMKGKLSYMAPEQLKARGVDRRTDVFAAGIVFWESLTGRRLFDGGVASEVLDMILKDEVPPPSSLHPGLSREVDALVLKALEKEPDRRYQSARQFAIAIEDTIPLASAREVGEWVEKVAGETLSRREETVAEIESVTETSDLSSESSPGFLKTLDGHLRAPALARAAKKEGPSNGAAAPGSEWDEAPTSVYDASRYGKFVTGDKTTVHVPHPSPPAAPSAPKIPPRRNANQGSVRPSVPRAPAAPQRNGPSAKADSAPPPVPSSRPVPSRPISSRPLPSRPASSRPQPPRPTSSAPPPPPSRPAASSQPVPSSGRSASRDAGSSAIAPVSGRTQLSMPPPIPKRSPRPDAPEAPVSSHKVVSVGTQQSSSHADPTPARPLAKAADFAEEDTTVYERTDEAISPTSSFAASVDARSLKASGGVYEPPAIPPQLGSNEQASSEHPPTVIVNDPGEPVKPRVAALPTLPREMRVEDSDRDIESDGMESSAPATKEGSGELKSARSARRAYNETQPAKRSPFFSAFDKTQPNIRPSRSEPPRRRPVLLYVLGGLLAVMSFAGAFFMSRKRLAPPHAVEMSIPRPKQPVETVSLEQRSADKHEALATDQSQAAAEPQAVDPSSLPPVEADSADVREESPSPEAPKQKATATRRSSQTRTVSSSPKPRTAAVSSSDTAATKASSVKVDDDKAAAHEQDLLNNPYAGVKAPKSQTPNAAPTKPPECAQPYEVDSNGIRRIKPQCL